MNYFFRNQALTAVDMVLVTLRFLATGSVLSVVGDLSGIHKSTISRTVHRVIICIARLRQEFIEMPSNIEDITEVRQGFYNIARFPRVIGALDCTHVKIISPGGENGEIFRNRKGYFSKNVQVVCDSDLIIRNIVTRWQGSAHDATIFANSRLRARIEDNEFGDDSLILGDSGYPIKKYLLTPLGDPRTPAEHLYNESQIRTRNPVERCFGSWKRRFPGLALGIRLKFDKVDPTIVASAIIHNIATQMNDAVPKVNEEEEAAIALTNNVDHHDVGGNHIHLNNIARHTLINDYFQMLL